MITRGKSWLEESNSLFLKKENRKPISIYNVLADRLSGLQL
jgi:hypothetical protein